MSTISATTAIEPVRRNPARAADAVPAVHQAAAPERTKSEPPAPEHRVQSYYDEAAHRSAFRVTDATTGNVVTEVPSENLLKFYQSFQAELAADVPLPGMAGAPSE